MPESIQPGQPRPAHLTTRLTNEAYVQLLNLSKTTKQPVSKVASDIISNHLGSKGYQTEVHHITAEEFKKLRFMPRLTNLVDQLNMNMAIVQQYKDETPFHRRLDENGVLFKWEVFFEQSCQIVVQIEELINSMKDE